MKDGTKVLLKQKSFWAAVVSAMAMVILAYTDIEIDQENAVGLILAMVTVGMSTFASRNVNDAPKGTDRPTDAE